MSAIWQRIVRGVVGRHGAIALVGLLVLAACGGGGGGATVTAGGASAGTTDQGNGNVTIALADAAGDFMSYTVDVVRIELRRTNGDVVQALPVSTRVDFVELAQLSELVGVATVPAGRYEEVRLLLDYANAEIVVQDANGNARAASPRDANGNTLGQLEVTLKLADRDAIVITRGVEKVFTIDFDLAASNVVSFDPDIVTVSPLLVATAELDRAREHRLRGLLDAVDRAASTVTLDLRPHGAHGGLFGSATFAVTTTTTYEIDGTAYVGDAGLGALAAVADGALVVANGVVSDRRLTAARVLVGSSVPGASSDVVHGVVVARSGNTLTVAGAHARRAGDARFGTRAVTVELADTTIVTSRLGDGALGIAALSVGSRIGASGTLATSDDGVVLDARAGRVVLEPTDVTGRVVTASPLVIAVAHIDGVRPAAFDFAGTGVTTTDDSDPAAYEVDTTGLSTVALAAGDLVRVRGRVADFGAAPPDFDAVSFAVLDKGDPGASLQVSWRAVGGVTNAFTTLSATQIVIDLAAARSELHQRGVRLGSSPAPVDALLPASDGAGTFVVHVRGGGNVTHYSSFAAFTTALQGLLDGSRAVVRIGASGNYDADARTLTARRIAIELVTR